jgi:hypothetical protein
MEKELPGLNWREVKRWAWIVASVGVFGLMYYWVLGYASAHTRQGNLILAVLTAVGALGIYAAVAGTNEFYGRRKWSYHRYGRIIALVVTGLVVSHVVGFIMPTPGLQSYFVFAPLVLFTASVFVLVAIGWVRSFRRD